ncbi:LOG family protein [Bradyrhizobium sp. dw_411]|uniref:LOG family protein n=1 Tax=Bradyrhizobium sp. dw_411 TaxID=2720082 RepID=UPI001BCD1273|nr:LOG family protein [Bradyrhizobium sp. dw_411]
MIRRRRRIFWPAINTHFVARDGGARVPAPEQAAAAIEAANSESEKALAGKLRQRSEFYRIAREFGRIASQHGGAFAPKNRWRDNVIATGGGPGIMEAANRGAFDVGAPSIGFNITLPHEQVPNPYITPELSFRFHYFAMRKMHLAMRANALAIFPGGFGTLDEMFELLTLQQTHKAPPAPIVLFGESYWRRIINFGALVEEGMITADDLHLFEFAETAEDGWASLVRRGLQAHGTNPVG